MLIYLGSDQLLLSLTLSNFASDLGHEVVACPSIEALLERLEKRPGPVDLVLLALPLSPGEGVRGLRTIHQAYPETPVLLAGEQLPLSPDEALALGVCGYLRLPIRLREVEFMFRYLSKNRTSRQFLIPPSDDGAQRGSE